MDNKKQVVKGAVKKAAANIKPTGAMPKSTNPNSRENYGPAMTGAYESVYGKVPQASKALDAALTPGRFEKLPGSISKTNEAPSPFSMVREGAKSFLKKAVKTAGDVTRPISQYLKDQVSGPKEEELTEEQKQGKPYTGEPDLSYKPKSLKIPKIRK